MNYTLTITYTRDKCPFDPKKKGKVWCKTCKAFNDPCSGIGNTVTVSSKKISKERMNNLLNLIK